jgi:hypothetical protein
VASVHEPVWERCRAVRPQALTRRRACRATRESSRVKWCTTSAPADLAVCLADVQADHLTPVRLMHRVRVDRCSTFRRGARSLGVARWTAQMPRLIPHDVWRTLCPECVGRAHDAEMAVVERGDFSLAQHLGGGDDRASTRPSGRSL